MRVLKKILSLLWDGWCLISIIGIWPRYIEPRLLKKKLLTIEIPDLPTDLEGLKILQFSDLHFNEKTPHSFLKKIRRTVNKLRPDLILFTGDFICYSRLDEKEVLKKFLESFYAPYGCFCVFGNHDYRSYVTLNSQGDFDIASRSSLFKAFRLLFKKKLHQGKPTSQALSIPFHEDLYQLVQQSPFKLLENETQFIAIKNSGLNICGLGDLWLGRCRPETAFSGYNPHYPGVILSHNPDSYKMLTDLPGELILCGHTHGEQVHFPGLLRGISKRLAGLSKESLSRGLYKINQKKIYVTHGVGCHKPFRFCSTPEILTFVLKNGS